MPEEVVVPVNELAPAANTAPDAGETVAPAELVQGEETKQADAPKSYTQEELDAIIGKRVAKEQRKAQREADRRVADAVARATPRQTTPLPEPKPEQFTTTEDYVKAVAKHAVAEDKSQNAVTQQQNVQQSRQSEINAQYSEVLSRGEEKYEDFDAAMYVVSQLPIPDETGVALKEAIAESENGDELLYYLGKHKAEALQLAKLSPYRALVELGKIGAKLTPASTPSKKTSSAPAPISPVTPSSGSTYTNLDDPKALKAMGTTAWINAMREQKMNAARAKR